MINYVIGDVRSHKRTKPIVFIPHCCNDQAVMGSGVAAALYSKWPEVKERYLRMPMMLGTCGYVKIDGGETIVCNMIGQHKTMIKYVDGVAVGEDGKPPLRYAHLALAMLNVGGWLEGFEGKCEVHCPMFGGDLAGGNWDFISTLIEEIWCPWCPVTCVIHESKAEQYKHLLEQ